MRTICLTGGIAGGKTTVAEVFVGLGATVVHADDLAKHLMTRPDVQEKLTDALGRSFFTPDGGFSESELADHIFNNPDALKIVNSIIHPLVYDEIDRHYDEVKDRQGCFVVETALAVETGYADWFDIVVVVSSPAGDRIQRLVEMKAFAPEEAAARMKSQLPQSEKIRRADYVIENTGTLPELEEKAKTLYKKLCENE